MICLQTAACCPTYYLQRDHYAVAPHPPPKGEAEASESDVRPPRRTADFSTRAKESADTFPPLKSVVGGVVAIWDIAECAKHSRTDARDIAFRTKKIVDLIADAIPDPSEIPPSMLLSIDRFTLINSSPSSALDEIRCGMEAIELSGSLSCLVHLNCHDRTIQGIKTRLDAEYRDFLAASALRAEVQQAANALIQAQMQSDMKMVSVSTVHFRTVYYTTDQTRYLYTPYTPHTSNKHTPGRRDSDFITPSVAPGFAIGTWELPWP
ncbi:hypothetical protein C8J57DRAFT_1252189 [Mycena rebaudengoi]|nr:hypothetical protein C8J57DRAFT_1252189 [Mycena rebaudengoi]